ncbi:ATP-binding protein [Bradyrhizobium commune]|uniref:AAA family ATPase n=1 Tax=Bradyrhizobium commune TaxID=83627 RepID=A0A7S9DB42_9BRAD|nr:AAA family ATPase [Bradyrhizobium commune]QPF94368.1 AAA family ATPase [Bradyrhizobium commune]
MSTVHAFGPFRLDANAGILFHGTEPVALGRRAVALLRVLVEKSGEPVARDALVEAAWAGLAIEDSNLSVQIAALRKALGAEPGGDRWIETLPRRGYRFVGPSTGSSQQGPTAERTSVVAPRSRWLVGRRGLLQKLDGTMRRMLGGERQVAFVTGEAGIGKTSFVEMAAEQLSRHGVDFLAGQCTERFGTNEPFLPLIDALTTRCRGPGGSSLVEAIRSHAPTWLLQMPGFLEGVDRAAFQNEVFGATRERMLREFCDLLEALGADRPWALIIEDMHWSDFATVDVLSRFARGDRRTSILVLGTYRPDDATAQGHPVRRLHQDLEIHGRCSELQLDRLSSMEVKHHLALRFQDEELASVLSGPMFGRSQGQPLFIASLVDYFVNQESIVQIDGAWRLGSGIAISDDVVPKDLSNLITHRIDRLTDDERQLLEVASVAGSECPAALVAAGLARDEMQTEEILAELTRRDRTLVSSGVSEWPDGTYSGSYAFHHILYQNVLYQRLPPARRVQVHRRMGERLERGYAGRTENIAASLALHFEQSRDFPRALRYLSQAAENSAKRLGHEEATNYLSRALGILDRLGATDQYGARINLLRQRSWALRSAGDLGGSVRDLNEMIATAAAAGQLRQEVNGLLAVSRFCLHADRRVCLHASDEALAKSEALEDDALKALVQGSSASINLYLKGWSEKDAALCQKALQATAEARDHSTLIRRYGIEGILECWRSHYQECRRTGTDGKRLAQEVGDVYIFVLFNVLESTALLHLGEWRQLQRETVAALALAERNANRPAIALCRLTLAWLHVEAMDFEGARQLCESVDEAVLDENPFAFFFQRAVLAKAFVGMNEPQRARELFDDVTSRLDADGICLDFTIYTQLYHCLGEYGLQTGDLAQARSSAAKLHDYAAPAPDRNHLVQALGLLAKIACAAGDLDEARLQLARALSVLDNADMPLAAWRIHRTAAEIYASLGEAAEAARHRVRFEQIIRKLAENFDPTDKLRSSLLAAIDAPHQD